MRRAEICDQYTHEMMRLSRPAIDEPRRLSAAFLLYILYDLARL